MNSFSKDGVTRRVQLYLDPIAAKKLHGPLIFYWYGTAGVPSQAMEGLGIEGVKRVMSLGGIVAAATHINPGAFPWINGSTAQEFALMDEVLACAIQKVGVDVRHIHAMGFSTGALLAAQAGYARSGYLASVVTYSGGASNAPSQDPNNLFPVMIFYGGANDRVLLNFQAASLQYSNGLVKTGHVVVLCNHASGHRLPTEAAPAALQFLLDHPFRQGSEPYRQGLPAGFPTYCTL
jgi:predicted esterase